MISEQNNYCDDNIHRYNVVSFIIFIHHGRLKNLYTLQVKNPLKSIFDILQNYFKPYNKILNILQLILTK